VLAYYSTCYLKDEEMQRILNQRSVVVLHQLKTINAMASTATKVLMQIACKHAKQEKTTESAGDDKDWDFCKFIYHKMKDVPDGDEKEDMQLSIQQIIAETKRKCRNGRSEVIASCTNNFQGNVNNFASSLSAVREGPQVSQQNFTSSNGFESYQGHSYAEMR
jgi:predicted metallo-beta-lactamase superfamily hydrolase